MQSSKIKPATRFKTVDALWEKLSPGGEVLMPLDRYPFNEKYGWIADRYGLSWQIVPTIMTEMMKDDDPDKLAKVTVAFLKMKKFDIEELINAWES
jgi:predicted 3-demethylubiquinone-9 3-methyltransferase (glyoxalase superfamily)